MTPETFLKIAWNGRLAGGFKHIPNEMAKKLISASLTNFKTTTMTETTNTLPELNLEIVNKQVADGLARAEEVMKKTAELKERSLTVKISDANDKVGYLATKEFLSEVRPMRSSLESERKACVTPFNNLVGIINAKYKEATSALMGIEAPHKQEKEEYEAAIEQKKADEAAAQEKIITDKINLLIKNGLEYNPNNGMYELDFNGKMVSVGRLDVVNMESQRFEQLIERASGIKEEKEKAETERLRAQQILQERRNSLLLLGMRFLGTECNIIELETGAEIMVSDEQLSKMTDENFVIVRDRISELADNNKKYTTAIKEAADKLAKDKADLQAQQEKLKRDKITVLQNRLGAEGFNFTYANPIENACFVFSNFHGQVRGIISTLLDNEEAVIDTINQARKLISKLTETNEAINKTQADALKKLSEQEVKNKADKQKKEAAKKVDSKKDLDSIKPYLSTIECEIKVIEEKNFKVIGEYATQLTTEINTAINNFNNSVKHLSS